jgi:NAD(P)-dependent dehydrogenase (short-subunit alcohol dehydrogenase family)
MSTRTARPALADLDIAVFAATGAIGRGTAAALDPAAVDAHLAAIAADRGLHGVVNAIGLPPVELGYPAVSDDLDPATFRKPFEVIVTSTFITARSGARIMGAADGGAVVTLSSSLTGGSFPHMASLTGACGAIEAMTRSLAGEYAPLGVRVNCVRADAMPETATIQQTGAGQAAIAGIAPEDFQLSPTPRGGPLSVAETAEAIAFLLSPAAAGIGSQVVTVADRAMAG